MKIDFIFDPPAEARIDRFIQSQPNLEARLYLSFSDDGSVLIPLLGSYSSDNTISGEWIGMKSGRLFVSNGLIEAIGNAHIVLYKHSVDGHDVTEFRIAPKSGNQ